MEGEKVVPNPTGEKYSGLQDNVPTVNYSFFYHPESIQPDLYKTNFGFPNYPNILSEAGKPFKASGVKLPWYVGNGNHDIQFLGNYPYLLDSIKELCNTYSTDTNLIQELPPNLLLPLAQALANQDAESIQNIINESIQRQVPSSDKRLHFDTKNYIKQFLNSKSYPRGHGYTTCNLHSKTLYYTFDLHPKIKGIMLDTCNPNGNLVDIAASPNGSIDVIQMAWLERKMRKYSRFYYDQKNTLIDTKIKNPKLIVLFSHHNSQTLNNDYIDPKYPPTSTPRLTWDKIFPILSRYPNIILWVNGHTHYNYIEPHSTPNSITKGFCEVNTASHIDYPQQSRVFEITEKDSILSIYTTLIDHNAPPSHCSHCPSLPKLASVAREMASNNYFIDPLPRLGTPLDRNTELRLYNPLYLAK